MEQESVPEVKEKILRSLREFYPLKVDEVVLISAAQKGSRHDSVRAIDEAIRSLREDGLIEWSLVRAPFGTAATPRYKISSIGIEHLETLGGGGDRDRFLPLAEIESRLVETYDQFRSDMARMREDERRRSKELETAVGELSKRVDELSSRLSETADTLDTYVRRVEDERIEEEQLVLRILSGDERAVYQIVLEAGGELFQKDLISRCRMSNAKVSRTLDRLEGRGILTKERHGATNRIRLMVKPRT